MNCSSQTFLKIQKFFFSRKHTVVFVEDKIAYHEVSIGDITPDSVEVVQV